MPYNRTQTLQFLIGEKGMGKGGEDFSRWEWQKRGEEREIDR